MDLDLFLRDAVRGMGIVFMAAIMLFYLIFLCRDLCEKYFNREIDRIYPHDIVIQNMGANEQPLPSYEDVARAASALTTNQRQRRRRNHRHDNVTSDDADNKEIVDTNTQLDGDSTGDSTTEDHGNDNENSGIQNIRNDSGITLNVMEVVKLSNRKEKSNKSDEADDSGIKTDTGNNTFDKFDDIKSNYNTASGSSAVGGASRAPSPWINF